jgi:hypothetical protein
MFNRQSDGATIAQQYAREGITLRPASMDRVNGWAEVLQRLGDPQAGIAPRLFIHQRCERLAETLPTLQHDPNRPEDVLKVDADEDGIGGEDAADALRYLVATRARRWSSVNCGDSEGEKNIQQKIAKGTKDYGDGDLTRASGRHISNYLIIPHGVSIHKNATPRTKTSKVWLERPRRLNNACISAPINRTARHNT